MAKDIVNQELPLRVTALEVVATNLTQSLQRLTDIVREDFGTISREIKISNENTNHAIQILTDRMSDGQRPDWQVWLTASGICIMVLGAMLFPVWQSDNFIYYRLDELKQNIRELRNVHLDDNALRTSKNDK